MNETIDEAIMIDNKFAIHRIKFIVFLSFQIPSIILSICFFIYCFKHRNVIFMRQNQGLFILIIVNFCQVSFDMPMVIRFNQLGYVSPATASYCTWWTFCEYSLIVQSELLMSVISMQRHIFVFRGSLFNIRLYRYLFHHIPLLVFLVYPVIFYLSAIIFYPCDGTQWDYQSSVCGLANCYLVYNKVLATFDWSFNNGVPLFIITLANLTLIFRVIGQKRRTVGYISWKKQRRMTRQLLSISCLYFFGWLPSLTIGLCQQLYSPTFLSNIQVTYAYDLIYFICLFLPWIYLWLFPQFQLWLCKLVLNSFQKYNTVIPQNNFHQ